MRFYGIINQEGKVVKFAKTKKELGELGGKEAYFDYSSNGDSTWCIIITQNFCSGFMLWQYHYDAIRKFAKSDSALKFIDIAKLDVLA